MIAAAFYFAYYVDKMANLVIGSSRVVFSSWYLIKLRAPKIF